MTGPHNSALQKEMSSLPPHRPEHPLPSSPAAFLSPCQSHTFIISKRLLSLTVLRVPPSLEELVESVHIWRSVLLVKSVIVDGVLRSVHLCSVSRIPRRG